MHQATSFRLLLKWIAAHTLAISFTAAITFSMISVETFGKTIAFLILSGVISGLCIGGVEALLLRPWLTKAAGWWVVVMVITVPLGMAGGGLLCFASLYFPGINEISEFMLAGALGCGIGALLGVAQWAFLRKVFRHTWIWMVAVTAGRTIGWSAGVEFAIKLDLWPNRALSAGIGGAFGGTLYGIVTGLCLAWFVANCKRGDNLLEQKIGE